MKRLHRLWFGLLLTSPAYAEAPTPVVDTALNVFALAFLGGLAYLLFRNED